jgi:hypothetical protein
MIEENSHVETGTADERLSKTQKITTFKDFNAADTLQTFKQLSFKDDFY